VAPANETTLSLTPPAPFNFAEAAYSHGWVVLAPNRWDSTRQVLQRTERLSNGTRVHLNITGSDTIETPEITIQVRHAKTLSPEERSEITTSVGHMFRCDEDLTEFYALCRKRGGHWIKITQGLGYLLRSPTLFEDIVKTICTTNIQWSGTKRMVEGLVQALGTPYPGDPSLRAFPTPEAIAAAPSKTFTETVHLGYRGRYIHELAAQVVAGILDLNALQDPTLSTPVLKKKLLAIKGVGNYAAATLLMLLGRYDALAIDTVFRDFVSKKYFEDRIPSEEEARSIYASWGKWQYLAYWFDLWQGLDETL